MIKSSFLTLVCTATIAIILSACGGGGGAPPIDGTQPSSNGGTPSAKDIKAITKGTLSIPDAEYHFSLSHKEKFIITDNKVGLRLIDIEKPHSPKALVSFDTGGSAGLTIEDDFLFLSKGYGRSLIYNIKNIKQPKLIRDLRNFGGYSIHQAHKKTMYDLSTTYNTLKVLNTDQLIYGTPFKSLYYPQVDRTIKDVYLDSIKVVSEDGKWLYGLGHSHSSPTQRFKIINISTDTAKTVYEKELKYSIKEFAISSDYKTAYLIEPYGGGLKIVDISSHDSHARLLSELKFGDDDIYTIKLSPDNLKAYVSYIYGFYVLDLSAEKPKIIEKFVLEKDDYFEKLIVSKDGKTGYILTIGVGDKSNKDNKLLIIDLP